MDGRRTVLVTGATSGLGRAAAGRLAATGGWSVLLGARDPGRGAQVAAGLGPTADVVALDLASLDGVRDAAARIAARGRLDALVLNAGVQLPVADRASADGYELTFAVNHLAHFLLTVELLPHLAPGARVVVVSSGTHWGTWRKSGPFPAPRWADPRELARPRRESGQRAYATSKLANVLFATELARRHPEVDVAVVDPGLVPGTGLHRGYPAPARAVYTGLAPLLARLPFASGVGQAADVLAAAVTGPPGTSGRYLERGVEVPSSPDSRDPARARELWEASRELTGS
ncbi:protochlorophyllide reductase [Geodermatophilus normandii]|uniref:Protochlorophyllide reductase n=1 Tax=Geodermatophilus normandii TaxID=1137989 RepID=A0A317QP94_9ACTN|nr:SDR family NAD(P)-dependent oxidoreductase [Geodermatophilus normandii]PWW24536.1 protochlorophyllide reductase [Geodermatophilus normandii]